MKLIHEREEGAYIPNGISYIKDSWIGVVVCLRIGRIIFRIRKRPDRLVSDGMPRWLFGACWNYKQEKWRSDSA